MTQAIAYLSFDGNCAEAMAFYKSCLGGDLTITTVGDTPMKEQLPPEQHHKVAPAHALRNVSPPRRVPALHWNF